MITFNDLLNLTNLFCFYKIKNGRSIGLDYSDIFKLNFIYPFKVDNLVTFQLCSIFTGLEVSTNIVSIGILDKPILYQPTLF